MAFWLLLLMLTACASAATTKDLSGKRFTFPEKTNTDNVKLIPKNGDFAAATVCLRFRSDLTRDYALFSTATATEDNAFLLSKDRKSDGRDALEFSVNGNKLLFEGLDFTLNKWHSLCATWDSATGLAQIWYDGMSTIKKYAAGPCITSPTFILGQDQDSVGGGFQSKEAFVGMICDVQMWSKVIRPCKIMAYMNDHNVKRRWGWNRRVRGNVLKWEKLKYEITGRVLVEKKEKKCCHRRPRRRGRGSNRW